MHTIMTAALQRQYLRTELTFWIPLVKGKLLLAHNKLAILDGLLLLEEYYLLGHNAA
jgi:hypothetical protein